MPAFVSSCISSFTPSLRPPPGKTPLHARRIPAVATATQPRTPRTPARVWTPSSWRDGSPALQQPSYADTDALATVEDRLRASPPLVFPGECDRLRGHLAAAAAGRAFVVQGGDCAETFHHFGPSSVESTFRALVAMSVVVSYLSGMPAIKLGRIAGQFAKPRSSDYEEVDGVMVPSFRGDIINSVEGSVEARQADPERIIRAYSQSASSLNMLRALAKSENTMLHWVDLIARLAPEPWKDFTTQIEDSLAFTAACGLGSSAMAEMREPEFYSSHEALLLPYEETLVRRGKDGGFYGTSAHFLWVGERTRQLDGAHLEFLRGLRNPLGAKIGPTMKPEELLTLIDTLNPENEPGRLTLIVRMGADEIDEMLPPLVRAVRDGDRCVVWSIDAMHGNTIKSSGGLKTRPFEKILSEITSFFRIHAEEGTFPGGVHLEMTGDETVAECLGGSAAKPVTDDMLAEGFKSACDPR